MLQQVRGMNTPIGSISTTGSTSPAGSTLGMVNGGAYEVRAAKCSRWREAERVGSAPASG